jgi:hypothetical protein
VGAPIHNEKRGAGRRSSRTRKLRCRWRAVQYTTYKFGQSVSSVSSSRCPRAHPASLAALATTLAFASAPMFTAVRWHFPFEHAKCLDRGRLAIDTSRERSPRVRGGLLSSLGGFVIRIRILMYCDVSCVYPEGYMYPSCILMYLKCILNALLHVHSKNALYMYFYVLHVFYTYPKRVQDTFWDTHQIHQDTCILGASLVSHWIHVRIHQDTCILDYSSRYIRIHRDTKLRYMYLEHAS